MSVSSSPDRFTFGLSSLGDDIQDILREDAATKLSNPMWQYNNLEYDLRSTSWILEKVKVDTYAQHIYAALCNNDFQKLEVVPILKEERWSCSWRHAGGIVADMQGKGDYIDWYCSGMGGLGGGGYSTEGTTNVTEGTVTEEIREDLNKLGWVVVD